MKRFKQYTLTEGVGAVKKAFVKSVKNPNAKLTEWDFKHIIDGLSSHYLDDDVIHQEPFSKKMINNYIEWIVRMYVFHNIDNDYKHHWDDVVIRDYIATWDILRNKRIVSNVPPVKHIQPLIGDMNKKIDSYAKKQTHKIPAGLKEGEDYEHVYNKDGYEVFKIMTHEASIKLGGKSKWCIRSEKEKWWNDLCTGYCFYFVVNHHRFYDQNNIIAIQIVISSGQIVNYWDMNDTSHGRSGDVYLNDLKTKFSNYTSFKPKTNTLDLKHYEYLQQVYIDLVEEIRVDTLRYTENPNVFMDEPSDDLTIWWEDHGFNLDSIIDSIDDIIKDGGNEIDWNAFYNVTSPTPMEYYKKHST